MQNCRLLTDLILTPTVPENSGRRQGGGCVANRAGERRGAALAREPQLGTALALLCTRLACTGCCLVEAAAGAGGL